MKKKLQEWLGLWSTAYPTASSPYWRSQPIGRMKSLLAGVFFSASVVGFAFDLPGSVNLIWPLLIFSFGSTPSGESTPAARRSEALRRP